MSYSTVYDTIRGQKQQLSKRESELKRRKRLIKRGLASKSSGMPSGSPLSRRRGRGSLVKRKKAVKSGLSSIKGAKKSLSSQKKQFKEYQDKGYKVRKTDDGYEFYKKTKKKVRTVKKTRPLTKSEFREQIKPSDVPKYEGEKVLSERQYENVMWDLSHGKSEVIKNSFKFKKGEDNTVSFIPGQKINYTARVVTNKKYVKTGTKKVETEAYKKWKKNKPPISNFFELAKWRTSEPTKYKTVPTFKVVPQYGTTQKTKIVYGQEEKQRILQEEAIQVDTGKMKTIPKQGRFLPGVLSPVKRVPVKSPAVTKVTNMVTGETTFDLKKQIKSSVTQKTITKSLDKQGAWLYDKLSPSAKKDLETSYEQNIIDWRSGKKDIGDINKTAQKNIGTVLKKKSKNLSFDEKSSYLKKFGEWETTKTGYRTEYKMGTTTVWGKTIPTGRLEETTVPFETKVMRDYDYFKDKGYGLKPVVRTDPNDPSGKIITPSLQPEFDYTDGEVFYAGKKVSAEDLPLYKGGSKFYKNLSSKKQSVLVDKILSSTSEKYHLPKEGVGGISHSKLSMDFYQRLSPKQKQKMYKLEEGFYEKPKVRQALESTVRNALNKTPKKFQESTFKKMDIVGRTGFSMAEGTVSGLSYPVVLAQTGVKYATGKGDWKNVMGRIKTGKTFLPDVGKYLSETKVSPAQGAIGGTISEGITLGKSDFFETAGKYPFQTAAATAGELIGIKTASAGVRYGVKGASKLPVKGFKRGIAATPHVTSKFSKVFPKAGSFIKPVKAVGKTQFGRNIYNWAAKGYKPGYTAGFISKGKPVYKQGWRIQKGVYKKIPGSRRFMPQSEFSKYQRLLNKSGEIDVGFPRSMSGADKGAVRIIGGAEGAVYKKSLFPFRKGLKYKGYSSTITKDIGVDIGKTNTIRPGLGSFIRGKNIVKTVVDVTKVKPVGKGIWFRQVGSMYKTGYPYRFTTLESGKQIVDFTKGFGKSYSKPLPKKWITKTKYGFTKSKEAAGRLLRTGSEKIVKPLSSSFKTSGRTGATVNIPSYSPSIGSYPVGTIGLLQYTNKQNRLKPKRMLETTQINNVTQKQRPISFTLSGYKPTSALFSGKSNKKIHTQLQKTLQRNIQFQPQQPSQFQGISQNRISIQMQNQMQKQMLLQKLKLKTTTKTTTKTPATSVPKTNIKFKPFIPPTLPKPQRRKKKKHKKYDPFGEVFKFRKGKLWSPFKGGIF